ncbi:hypothetical protein CTheo_8735 [Ceratobasidium theobromae]|uniref:Uncharacterized protein n=1 Tax=Ceratobasidium theobromae TaxID=1582974 RepID=A0A5N5Q8J6_9AGAM|nr:hypothetical protein CTheo_8735 [Ceratobasidium theobromae]
MRSKISITTTSTPITIATPIHTSTLPPYSVQHPSRYTLSNPKPSLYSSIQLARCLLVVFHHENVTEDQILLVEHIVRSVSEFKYGRKPKKSMTELSWSAFERMSIDLVVLAGGCGVSLRNKDWKGPKIDLRELYHRVVEKVACDLLKSGVSVESSNGNGAVTNQVEELTELWRVDYLESEGDTRGGGGISSGSGSGHTQDRFGVVYESNGDESRELEGCGYEGGDAGGSDGGGEGGRGEGGKSRVGDGRGYGKGGVVDRGDGYEGS